MRITPNHIAIGRIFEQNTLFEVPKYQRYYAWEDEQVKDFITDIDNIITNSTPESPLEHFFGGIVCVSKIVEGSNRQQKELIDGQQRITTSILLIVNIIREYRKLYENTTVEDERVIINARLNKLKEKYLIYHDEINRRPQIVKKLVLSEADKQFFNNILDDIRTSPTRDSHRKIAKADYLLAEYVKDKLSHLTSISEKIDLLADIESTLNDRCTVIFMDCDSRSSAYKLFQVLNDRGAGLNEGDLLKSKALEALEQYVEEQESVLEFWDEVLEQEPSEVEGFLRTYYASCCGKRAGRASLYDDFLLKFFPSLAAGGFQPSRDDAQHLVEKIKQIRDEALLYRKITIGEWPYPEAQPITMWDRNRLKVLVNFLSYEITLPLLLAATKLDQKKFSQLVHVLERFMFRYKTICGNSHQRLSELYNAEAKKIRDNPCEYSFSTLFAELRRLINEHASNEVFSVQLKNLKYQTSGGNKTLRYFFSTLCDYYRWHQAGGQGKPTATKEYVINYDNVTIEHIDSQHPSLGNILVIDDLHKFLNLTILSQDDNGRRVSNKPFTEKKSIYGASNYHINQELCKYEEWSQENAERWQQYLTDFACRVFVV